MPADIEAIIPTMAAIAITAIIAGPKIAPNASPAAANDVPAARPLARRGIVTVTTPTIDVIIAVLIYLTIEVGIWIKYLN